MSIHLAHLAWIVALIPAKRAPIHQGSIPPSSLWPYRQPSLNEGPTISTHGFPCHTVSDTRMHLLSISAREGGCPGNRHPRVCVLWAHDCAACRCSSGADAKKSIRIWASDHLKPLTIDQAQHTFSFTPAPCFLQLLQLKSERWSWTQSFH